MSQKHRALAGLGIVLISALASVLAYPDLPNQMAIHFTADGTPDDYMRKQLAVALVPALELAILGMYAVIPRIDPLGENIAQFETYYDLAAIVTVAILAYVHGAVLGYNLGYRFEMAQVVAPMLAVVGIVFGFVVENAKQNWFVGIRTPWTLSNEEVWTRTHERSGILFKVAGLIALLAIPFPQYFEVLAIAPLALAALLPTVYSYVLYRRISHA
ncbi:SdpI family protein [Salinibaculum salinum]|uniref:SdpI family protein n=1 Tax=Salinibaculum salinum TaxID=3131996 RepID=UPI0030EB8EE5